MQANAHNNRKVKRQNRIRILLLSISITLLALIGFGLWYWNTNKNVIIENKLEKAITKNNDGLYRVSYDDMIVNEEIGSLMVSNMKLWVDSTRYATMDKEGKSPPMLFTITIPELIVIGVKTSKALLDKEIVGRKIEIRNPVIDLEYTNKGKNSRHVPTEAIYREVLGNLDMIQMDSVLITGAEVRTKNGKTGKRIIDVKNIDVALMDVRVDSAANMDSTRFLFAKNIHVNVANIGWPSPDNLYTYRAENISLNSNGGRLSVKQFSVRPGLSETAFVNAIPTQEDRFNFSFNNIVFSGVVVQRLLDEYIQADAMTIGGASFKVYRDLARPRDKKNRVGYYPHQVLDDIPIRFAVKKVNIRNSFVEYKERNHITRQSGKVQFYNVNGTITNFTNDKKASNKVMRAFVNSSFLNKTSLKTDWTFYLFHPKGRFDVSGTIGAIDGQALNSLAEPMGPASIEEGRLNAMSFDLHGDDYTMDGNVKMLYEDLDVAILEKDKGATETDKKFLTSLIANIVIKNSNPKGNDAVRVQQVHLARNTNRSLFNLCWKTIFQGIRGTVGIRPATAAR